MPQDTSCSIHKAMFMDSCRELLTRALNRDGKKKHSFGPTQPLDLSAERQAKIHLNLSVKMEPKQLSGLAEKMEEVVINAMESTCTRPS